MSMSCRKRYGVSDGQGPSQSVNGVNPELDGGRLKSVIVTLRVDVEEVPGRGWVAHAPEARATAQGDTREEALANLHELLDRFPEVLDEIWADARHHGRTVELITA